MKTKWRKPLILLLTAGLVFCLLPFLAFAEEDVCQIIDAGGNTLAVYTSLTGALSAVTDGQIIQLLENIDHKAGIAISGKTVTFDVNGKILNVVNKSGYGLEVGAGGAALLIDSLSNGIFNVSGSNHGVYAHSGGKAEVTSATNTSMNNCVNASGAGTSVTVFGDTIGGFYALSATDGATLTVYGNVNGGGGMVVSGAGTTVTVYGNSSGGGTGVFATNGVTVYVKGNVTGGGSGVWADSGAQVTVDGYVKATSGNKTYISFSNDKIRKMQEDFEPASSKEGYYEYTDGASNVWVKEFNPPLQAVIAIVTPPQDTEVSEGAITESLRCEAEITVGGKPLAPLYQWYSNTANSNLGGTKIVGQTGASFPIPTALTAADGPYYYYCVVSAQGANSLTSEAAKVTVTASGGNGPGGQEPGDKEPGDKEPGDKEPGDKEPDTQEQGGGGNPPPPPILTPSAISVTLEAKKTVEGPGAQLSDKQFNFAVYEDGAVAATGKNDASGKIVFSAIPYTEAGTYNYVIKETTKDGNGWITDTKEYHATVKVTTHNNALSAAVSYQNGAPPVFHNRYEPGTATLSISKLLVDTAGNKAASGEIFWVVLYEKAGAAWTKLGEYAVAANGKATAIPDLAGGKTYQLVEKTNGWYNILGFQVLEDAQTIGRASGAAVAVMIPQLNQNITIDVVVSNEQTTAPSGTPGGGGPAAEPPLIEIEEEQTPQNLFTNSHLAYVLGYPDGTVGPERPITRAEVATIFFRLLADDVREEHSAQMNPYSDVATASWYNNAVSVMSHMHIVTGYPSGAFKPEGAITRAELAAISARFARIMAMAPSNDPPDDAGFEDTGGHWAKDDIDYAASLGWMNGYPDKTFKPGQPITRAEVMTLVNRMLKRMPESAADLLTGEMTTWADNTDTGAWYYLAVQEATNSHVPGFKEGLAPGFNFAYEYWKEITADRDWTQI